MKTNQLNTLIVSFAFSFLFTGFTSAQIFRGTKADELVKGSSEVRIDEKRKSISFVNIRKENFVSADDPGKWLLQSVFKARTEDGLQLYKTEPDLFGYTHFRYRQLYRNVPVEFSMFIVHARGGKIISANGEYYPGIDMTVQPLITGQQALRAARNNVNADSYKTDVNNISQPELVILRLDDESYKLAWKTDVYAEKPLSRNWIYIDGQTGNILKKINRIETIDVSGTAVTRYSGTKSIRVDSMSVANYRLQESARSAGNGMVTRNLNNGSSYPSATEFINTSNTWLFSYDNAALDAHYGAEKTYDHYYSRYGYNSFDNTGGTIFSYVHYGSNYVNAFWDGTEMTYGDGDGFQYTPLTSLEIVGHEITHGVTERSAGLIYSGESGALNESFSDIMGNTIRFIYDSAFATWYCGDQIVIPGAGGSPIRNLANPNDFQCPDTYGGTYWNAGDIVHYNSGVQNFWYYLLTAGGSGVNDNGDSYTVNGIGLTDANAIAFRNLTVYLTPNSTFADARTYAIQAATDLFGSCSNQVIQTTNAWYAVGVGNIFSNAVVASFSATQNYFCIAPATVFFTNNSFNATSYTWSFGDGNSSTSASPSHVYSAPGIYTVRLIASGTASCGNSDTLVLTNYVTVTNTGGPVSPSCTPVTISTCCGIGITRVQFNTINNSSTTATEGYRDFTCSNVTTLTAGDPYPLTVTTGFTNNENVKAWIDFNNDGTLNSANEVVFASANHAFTHTGIVHTPVSAVLNTPLRMRVMDDNSINPISSSCYNPQAGQAEDYTVSFIANTLPPHADFIASDTVINAGDTVRFTDLSIHAPTAWTWSFPGGTSANLTAQNPSAVYNVIGTYPVTLRVTNSFGADSITKTLYIHVVNYVYMCTATSTVSANGLLFDSGGPLSNYQDGENCSFLISPACATSITLSFSSLQMESCCDLLRVYNGSNMAAPLLLSVTGSVTPASVTATSGQMLIVFTSDGSVTLPGFAATWSSVIASSLPPVAAFSIGDPTPPLNAAVQLTDQSTNSPTSWIWDFGDGNFSTLQNPAHAYTSQGLKTIKLIAFTCTQSDTITQSLTVQPPPSVSVTPTSLNASAACGDSVTVFLTVHNSGSGDLTYSTLGSGNDSVKVLAFTYGADISQEYPNTLAALNQYFTRYSVQVFNGTNAAALQAALAGKDVLLFPEQESSLSNIYTALATVVQNFAAAGGTVIVCGSSNSFANRIYDMGLFTGNILGSSSSTLTTLDTTDAITEQVPLTFNAPNATFPLTITNPDKIQLVVPLGNTTDIVTYRNIGTGKAIFLGFDYFGYNNATAHLVANAVSLPHSSLASWVSASPNADTVVAGDSSVIQVTFYTSGLFAGIHTTSIILNTNDPLNPTVTVPCTLTVSGSPSIALSQTCVNFGSVMQFSTASDTFNITNNGCDTLHITGLNPLPAEYTVTGGNMHIPPHSSSAFIVHFTPTTIGTFNGNLLIHNNDTDTLICLTGSATGAPVISVNPDSFNVTLLSGDSTTRPLTISNQGLGNLTYTIHGSGSGLSGDTSVLVIQESDAWGLNMMNFLQTNFGITPDVITSSQIAATDFMQYDVVITVGDESNTYYTNISNNVAKFEAFAAAGGIIQYQMATQGGTNVNLAGGAHIIHGNPQPQNTGLLPAHPILAGISNPLNGSSANHCYITNLPVGTQIITQTSTLALPTTVEYSYGNGMVIATGMTWEFLYLSAFNTAPMLPNSISYIFSKIGGLEHWLSLSSAADTVIPSDSSVVDVKFNATGLNAGVYTSLLTIDSNDPVTPQVNVPCTLNVIGIPKIILSDSSINFGNVFVGGSKKDTLIVINTGTDTLKVFNLVSGDAVFTMNINGFNLPPGDSQDVVITFAPVSVSSYATTLTIVNNDHDTIVHLYGNGVVAPILTVTPASFDVSLNSCSDSITLPLKIFNPGGSTLTYTISGTGSAGAAEVLALTYGTDLSTEYPNTIAAINQYFTSYTLTTINTTSPSVLQAALSGKNVFLMPESETGMPSVYAGFASVLQNFVSNGGTAIVCGALDAQSDCIFNTGLFSGSYGTEGTFNTLNVTNNSTPITTGVASSFTGPNATFCLNITDGNKIKLVDYLGSDVVTYRNIGSGRAIFLAFDYFNYGTNEALLIANAMQWATSNQLMGWTHLSSDSGSVAPGDSDIVYVTFNSENLDGGIYQGNIIIHSNDPLLPDDTIQCTLHVSFTPCADISYTTSICSGTVNFMSSSVNTPTGFAWTFGDGGTSALANPLHNYAAGGVYNVRLIECNASGCDTAYTTVNLGSVGGPIAASCSAVTTNNCCGIGIQNVTFGNINKTSADGSDGYQDYTCEDSTSVMRGQAYAISVQTGLVHNENVLVWIDYNNNGIFGTGELVFTSLNVLQSHTGFITIPNSGVVLNTPLRMRVGSDYYNNSSPSACGPVEYGQYEDYTVFVTFGVDINGTSSAPGLNVFPNPFAGDAAIEYTLDAAKKVSLDVYNVIGEKVTGILAAHVQTAGSYKYILKVEEPGIYLVVLTTDDGSIIRRVVKLN